MDNNSKRACVGVPTAARVPVSSHPPLSTANVPVTVNRAAPSAAATRRAAATSPLPTLSECRLCACEHRLAPVPQKDSDLSLKFMISKELADFQVFSPQKGCSLNRA